MSARVLCARDSGTLHFVEMFELVQRRGLPHLCPVRTHLTLCVPQDVIRQESKEEWARVSNNLARRKSTNVRVVVACGERWPYGHRLDTRG